MHLREVLVPLIRKLLNKGSWAKNADIHKSKASQGDMSPLLQLPPEIAMQWPCTKSAMCIWGQLFLMMPVRQNLCNWPWSGLKDHTQGFSLELDSSCITLIVYCMLNQFCIPQIHSIWSWCIILVICYQIFKRIFVSIKNIDLNFSILVTSVFFQVWCQSYLDLTDMFEVFSSFLEEFVEDWYF